MKILLNNVEKAISNHCATMEKMMMRTMEIMMMMMRTMEMMMMITMAMMMRTMEMTMTSMRMMMMLVIMIAFLKKQCGRVAHGNKRYVRRSESQTR